MLTAGDPAALAAALAPFRDAFAIHILPTPATTIFENIPTPQGRKQTLHGWAGPILPDALPAAWRRATILHLGPIADELPPDAWAEALGTTDARLTLATPQGWLRRWGTLPSPVRHEPLALPDALLDRLGAMVISVEERDVAEAAVRRVAIGWPRRDHRRPGWRGHPARGVRRPMSRPSRSRCATRRARAMSSRRRGRSRFARGESPEAAARVACARRLAQHHRARPARHPDRRGDRRAARDEFRPSRAMSAPYGMAGGFALRDEAGRLLLVHQAYGERVWDFVGGGAEPGESPEETAIREAKEEIGLTVAPRGLIGVYFNRARRIFIFIFAGVVTGGTLALATGRDRGNRLVQPGRSPAALRWKARQVADVFAWTGPATLRTRESRTVARPVHSYIPVARALHTCLPWYR